MTLKRTIDILRDLIAYPTISSDSNLEMIDALTEHLESMGARCFKTQDDTGRKANLFATLGPETDGGILLSGHTDVVPVEDQDWTSDPFEMVEQDDRLVGRGTADMKGFIAATLGFAETLDVARMTTPLHFSFTFDEETGCLGAQQLVGVLAERGIVPDIAIVGEPTEMRIIEGHKGCYEYTTYFQGLAGHSSAPDAGVNAAEYAARYVGKLLDLREALKARAPETSKFDPPWTTLNIGRIKSGVAHNVVACKGLVDWEMRPVQESDADFVKDSLDRYVENTLLPQMRNVFPGSNIWRTTIAEVVGLDPMPENAARTLVTQLTGANGTDLVAFGTEAGLFQQLGSSTVVCGPGSIAQAHKADEFLTIKQLGLCCEMLDRLGERLTS